MISVALILIDQFWKLVQKAVKLWVTEFDTSNLFCSGSFYALHIENSFTLSASGVSLYICLLTDSKVICILVWLRNCFLPTQNILIHWNHKMFVKGYYSCFIDKDLKIHLEWVPHSLGCLEQITFFVLKKEWKKSWGISWCDRFLIFVLFCM